MNTWPGPIQSAQGSDILLLAWLSPSFPVGAFAYSHGIEWAVETDDIHDALSLQEWIADLIACGSIRNDCILVAETMRAVQSGDLTQARDINSLALALSPSRERHLETISQGNAFLTTVEKVWPHASISSFLKSSADARLSRRTRRLRWRA